MATQKYQVLENRMISHAGVNYTGGDIVIDITPEKAEFHIKGKNLVPYVEEKAAIAAAPVTPPKEPKAPSK